MSDHDCGEDTCACLDPEDADEPMRGDDEIFADAFSGLDQVGPLVADSPLPPPAVDWWARFAEAVHALAERGVPESEIREQVHAVAADIIDQRRERGQHRLELFEVGCGACGEPDVYFARRPGRELYRAVCPACGEWEYIE